MLPLPPLRWAFLYVRLHSLQNLQTFSFVREGNRKEDWYSNILLQVKRKRDKTPAYKPKRKDDQIDEIAI
ncbi:MAG TPA: hypothetical protein DD452_08835 [Nitrospina sp.]|jgi:hypothetical protein|nr:hypothetical protein [Nitrospina sp.]